MTAPYDTGSMRIEGKDNLRRLEEKGFKIVMNHIGVAIVTAPDGRDEDWQYDDRTDAWLFCGVFDKD